MFALFLVFLLFLAGETTDYYLATAASQSSSSKIIRAKSYPICHST
ncbi:hypothetical protein RintRC_6467 [Richelia intracellularis]|nr:hypothetical protein RintRC_6467 [Richelia intracellularis]